MGYFPSRIPLSDLHWPLGRPEGISGLTLADLLPSDHLIITPQSAMYVHPTLGTRAQVSVLIMEPRAVHERHMRRILWFKNRFHSILTSDVTLLEHHPRSVFFVTAGSWVPEWQTIDIQKKEMCCLIASAKDKLTGHKLRHELVDWSRATNQNVRVMGNGYQPFNNKSDGLAPYRYSVVIENAREDNYFSEKLIDAILCNTVPIYWGCPNISEYFDTRGMIICESPSDLKHAIKQMSKEDYSARIQYLTKLRSAASEYAHIYSRAAKTLLATLPK